MEDPETIDEYFREQSYPVRGYQGPRDFLMMTFAVERNRALVGTKGFNPNEKYFSISCAVPGCRFRIHCGRQNLLLETSRVLHGT